MLRALVSVLVLSCLLTGRIEAQAAPAGACPPIIATRPTVVPPQRFKAGDIVPPFAMDEPLRWLECPEPELPSGAAPSALRRAFLFVTVDENGAVVDVKPRGAIDAQGYFDAAMAAVRKWRSTAPKWKTQAVRSSFAMDVIFGEKAPAPSPAPANPTQPAAASQAQPGPQNPPVRSEANENPPVTQPTPETKPAEPKKEVQSVPAATTPAVAPVSSPAQTAPEKPAPQPEPSPKQNEPPAPAKVETAPTSASHQTQIAGPAAAATSAPASQPPTPVAITTSAPATETAPVSALAEARPAPAATSCPHFFILPESQQSRRTYRSGELVPNAYLDQTPNWVECPWPDFSGMPPRTTAVIVMIDDKGAVRDVRPRGQPSNAAFERTRKAVMTWRVDPAPRYKSLPVWTSTALDIANDGRASGVATTPVPLPNAPPAAQPTGEAQASAEAPYTEEFYYKVKWGFADEFWRLFLKNHWPILRKQIETGRILEVRAEKPVFHATEDGRWDYRVTIVYRSTAARFAPVDTAALERQLYPDQETFKREEQRRFELLLAHWDLPVERVRLP